MQNLDTQSDEFPRARLINLAGLRERASIPTEWLIEGIYPLGEIILMVGEPHSGKTYVALDQGLAVAYGAPWLGIYDVPRPRPVLYVPTEGIKGIAKRVTVVAQRRVHIMATTNSCTRAIGLTSALTRAPRWHSNTDCARRLQRHVRQPIAPSRRSYRGPVFVAFP